MLFANTKKEMPAMDFFFVSSGDVIKLYNLEVQSSLIPLTTIQTPIKLFFFALIVIESGTKMSLKLIFFFVFFSIHFTFGQIKVSGMSVTVLKFLIMFLVATLVEHIREPLSFCPPPSNRWPEMPM